MNGAKILIQNTKQLYKPGGSWVECLNSRKLPKFSDGKNRAVKIVISTEKSVFKTKRAKLELT